MYGGGHGKIGTVILFQPHLWAGSHRHLQFPNLTIHPEQLK